MVHEPAVATYGGGVRDVMMTALEFVVLSLTAFLIGFLVFAKSGAECVELGYTSQRLLWFNRQYCVARENGTDVVLPIEQARQRPRIQP